MACRCRLHCRNANYFLHSKRPKFMILTVETEKPAQSEPAAPGPCRQCDGEIPRRTMPSGRIESVTGWRERKYCCQSCWGTYVTLHPEARHGGRPKSGAPRIAKLGRPRLTARVEALERVVKRLAAQSGNYEIPRLTAEVNP